MLIISKFRVFEAPNSTQGKETRQNKITHYYSSVSWLN